LPLLVPAIPAYVDEITLNPVATPNGIAVMNSEFDQIPEQPLAWLDQGKKTALATVIQTWGSAPRPVGAMLAISEAGEIAGSVSGGCVEGAVVVEAIDALKDGRVRLLEFGVSDDEAFAVGLACGGTIRIMVEPIGIGQGMPAAMLRDLVTARQNRRAVALAVNTRDWRRELSDGKTGSHRDEILLRLRSNKSGGADDWFFAIHNPPLKMVVVGAVHIAQSLVPMAKMAGYDVTLVDPRDAFATAARFPDITIRHDWPDAALKAIGLDARTAVVTLSHDPKIDDPAIKATLQSPAFYLGCLGSRKTHAKRLTRLQAAGIDDRLASRIHAPIGLAIGAASPAEIAISILAEVTETLHKVPEPA